MDNYFTPINALEQYALPAIASHTSQTGLYVGSLELNAKAEKYHLLATPGDTLPIAFENRETMAAFVRHLCTVAASGRDMTYQPTMRISGDLEGCKLLVYGNADLKLPDEVTRLTLPSDSRVFNVADSIAEKARELEARFVVIQDATSLLADTPSEFFRMAECLCLMQNLMLFFGIDVSAARPAALEYIARHAHSLCQLTEGSILKLNEADEPQAQNFFNFLYGWPTPHRIIYTIDESGTVKIPPTPTTDLLRMQECGKLFGEKCINQTTFSDRIFGYYGGRFQKTSILNMISEAVKHGILHRSGTRKAHTNVWLCDTPEHRRVYRGSIALKAKLDPYCKENGYCRAYEPLAFLGDCKLLLPEGKQSENATKRLVLELITAVAEGKRRLDFNVVTPHRNTLVVVVGTNVTAERVKAIIGQPKGASLDVICTGGTTISDCDFLSKYKAALNQHKPDFSFVLNFDSIEHSGYTPSQLCKEIAQAGENGIFSVIHMNRWNGSEPMPDADEVWKVKPLVDEATRADFYSMWPDSNLSPIYSFHANVGSQQFVTRFKFGDRGLILCKGKELQETFYRATFYWCDNTPREEIEDCTGKQVSISLVFQAERAGIIRINYPGKRAYKYGLISYIK